MTDVPWPADWQSGSPAAGRVRLRAARLPDLPHIPPWSIAAAAALAAAVYGRFMASGHIKYAVGLVLVALYAPVVLFAFPVAFGLYTSVLFFQDIKALSFAPNAMGVLVALGFLGTFTIRGEARAIVQQHRRLILIAVLLLLWLLITAAWAPATAQALRYSGFWWLGGLAFLIVLGTCRRESHVALLSMAFVGGATVAAVIGLSGVGLKPPDPTGHFVTQAALQTRLTGGAGDPNLQAAGFVAAMFLDVGLLSVYRRPWTRLGLLAAFVLITVAFLETQSRGGLIALGVACLAALILFPAQRRRLLGFAAIALVIAAVAAAGTPGALSRITDFGGGTSGRSDIWAVATQVFGQHPIVGVGLNNFPVVEPRFSLLHRNVTRATYIAEDPYPVHNTYLQLLAETGVVGLIGFLVFVVACLRAGWLAARRFERLGHKALANLAQATVMGTIGMLAAIFFISDGFDWRLWILLGLGPALLALSSGAASASAADSSPPPTRRVLLPAGDPVP
ncbi:MAG TPA: O-antigen ligase family protein [Solirubrobacteraceae bacterium]|nr:O-antigen ligase family protein [Solirubrobacteraceae bacterium]